MNRIFTAIAGKIAQYSGKPAAFILAAGLVIAWGLTGPMFGFS